MASEKKSEDDPSSSSAEYSVKVLFPDLDYPVKPPFPEYPLPDFVGPDQRKSIEDLRGKFTDPVESIALMRALVARRWDIEAAYKQLSEAIEWRKQFGANEILLKLPNKTELVKKLVPHAFHKTDHGGRPVYIERTGLIDVPRLINLVPKDDLMHNHVWGLEYQAMRCRQESKKSNRLIYQTTNVCDLTGLNFGSKKGLDFLKFMTELDQKMYPENVSSLYIINAPWIFGVLWKLVRGWLDPRTREKVHVLGSDYKERLLEVIPAENLPEEFGGTCRCSDSGCVPKQDLTGIEVDMFDPELTEAVVGAGKTLTLDFEAKGNRSTVSWFYRTTKHDIKFAVSFTPKDSTEKKYLVEPTKLDSTLARVEGTADVETAGKVTFEFDNSYSYWNSKTVRYCVSVESEEQTSA